MKLYKCKCLKWSVHSLPWGLKKAKALCRAVLPHAHDCAVPRVKGMPREPGTF